MYIRPGAASLQFPAMRQLLSTEDVHSPLPSVAIAFVAPEGLGEVAAIDMEVSP